MKHKLLVFCDLEEDYAQHMSEYLSRTGDFPWEIAVYTKIEELQCLAAKIDVLLISESAYEALQGEVPADRLIILCESGLLRKDTAVQIDKYQSAEKVKSSLINIIMDDEAWSFRMHKREKAKLIGMYSPVRRCLQTTFALTYGQLLAEKHRTLYLSFEYYDGKQEWQEGKQEDLSELLYFLQEEDSFLVHMKAIVQRKGSLDLVAPMMNGQNLLHVTLQDWLKLIQNISESGEYEYIILDLSESIQGLLEILRLCSRVYTIIKEDKVAKCKLTRYEKLLTMQEYEDIKKKTSKCILPFFRKLPEQPEQYTKGELAEYVRELLFREGIA